MTDLPNPKKIQVWDGARAFFASVLQPLSDSFAMLFLIQSFEANTLHKTIMGSVAGIGMLSGAPLLKSLKNSRWPASRLLALLFTMTALCLFCAPWVENIWLYLIFTGICIVIPYASLSLLTEVYTQFKSEQRGKRYLSTMIASNLGVLCFGSLGAWMAPMEHGKIWVLCSFGVCLLTAALCCLCLPSKAQKRDFQNFRQLIQTLKEDRLFAYMCSAWFILGAANLWIYPYRTNYLIEVGLGPELPASQAVFFVVLVPETLRFLSAPLYAKLFDRLNFITLRMGINALFASYAIIFFSSQHMLGIWTGSILLGLALGGGSFAWNLWVTKIAPPHKAPTYMIIHSTLTGIRRLGCPLIGLYALQNLGGSTCAIISAILMTISTLMLIPVLNMGNRFSH
jgi:hypothetical protein